MSMATPRCSGYGNAALSDDSLYVLKEPSVPYGNNTYNGDESDLFAAIARGRSGGRFYSMEEVLSDMRVIIDNAKRNACGI